MGQESELASNEDVEGGVLYCCVEGIRLRSLHLAGAGLNARPQHPVSIHFWGRYPLDIFRIFCYPAQNFTTVRLPKRHVHGGRC